MTLHGELQARPRRGPGNPGTTGRFLSNGDYRVLLTDSGTGGSWAGDHALTRWAGDAVENLDGCWLYLCDAGGGAAWSVGRQPLGEAALSYETTWEPGRFEILREDPGLRTRLEACVAPDAPFELRRLRVTNIGPAPRRLELTTCCEVALNDPLADAVHPAFSKLFIQTSFDEAAGALLARRRSRSPGEHHPVMFHALLGPGPLQLETDRARFLGRGRAPSRPRALDGNDPLGGTTGNVLDPVLCLRRTFELAPGATSELLFVLGAAPTEAAAVECVRGLEAAGSAAEIFRQAAARERGILERLRLEPAEAEALHARAAAAAYGLLAPGTGAITPDARAGEYARALGLPPGWSAALFEDLRGPAASAAALDPGDWYPRADAAFHGQGPDSTGIRTRGPEGPAGLPEEPLRFFNGWGGFTRDGREYVLRLPGAGVIEPSRPPMPWINVIANDHFGFLVSESGAGTTWSGNSREHRLTPWSNDPVLDPHHEALYLRDEDTGAAWSPLPGPMPDEGAYEVRHGLGYTTFLHATLGLYQECCMFAALEDPVKVVRLRLHNRSERPRRVSVFSYNRLVLGVLPGQHGRTVVTEFDAASGMLMARNPAAGDFASRVAFAAPVLAEDPLAAYVCCDREAFLGRNRAASAPDSVTRAKHLAGRTGAGLDPCFAQQVMLEVPVGGEVDCTFLLGEATSAGAARSLTTRYRRPGAVDAAFEAVAAYWNSLLSGLQVETPAPALDVLLNGWLPHQAISCRIRGRTAFYQSGGAFGFRDQLQDASALTALDPGLTRMQILTHAAHQFVEGDVLHWWHPPAGRGIRTRFADDLLWLPFVTASYTRATGDWSLLDERAPYLSARPLQPGEDEAFLEPGDSGTDGDIYDHCCRAIDRSMAVGRHGLPLFGSGDWNDAMNRVGREGRGESVWMGFFLFAVLGDFLPAMERRGDAGRLARYTRHREELRAALNREAWDGEWYLRGWYDDGTPLGSSGSDQCRIDALSQAWAVISGAAPADRAERSMQSVEERLVSEGEGLIRLLTPPFEDGDQDPGYIRGYVAGVRENGGQYTHAALWVVRALAELRRNDRAARLLEMLGPVAHSDTPARVGVYQVEPYVVAADVYGVAPHVGRGGWTWYTGSAGWMYRVALESVLGMQVLGGNSLRLKPCVPDHWPGFRIRMRVPGTETWYNILVENPGGRARIVTSASLDGAAAPVCDGEVRISLERDGREHTLEVQLG